MKIIEQDQLDFILDVTTQYAEHDDIDNDTIKDDKIRQLLINQTVILRLLSEIRNKLPKITTNPDDLSHYSDKDIKEALDWHKGLSIEEAWELKHEWNRDKPFDVIGILKVYKLVKCNNETA